MTKTGNMLTAHNVLSHTPACGTSRLAVHSPGRWAPGGQPLADVVGSEKLSAPLTTAPLAAAPLLPPTFLKSLQIPVWPTQITQGHRERMQRLKLTETEGPAGRCTGAGPAPPFQGVLAGGRLTWSEAEAGRSTGPGPSCPGDTGAAPSMMCGLRLLWGGAWVRGEERGPSRDAQQRCDGQGFGGGGSVPSAGREARVAGFTPSGCRITAGSGRGGLERLPGCTEQGPRAPQSHLPDRGRQKPEAAQTPGLPF